MHLGTTEEHAAHHFLEAFCSNLDRPEGIYIQYLDDDSCHISVQPMSSEKNSLKPSLSISLSKRTIVSFNTIGLDGLASVWYGEAGWAQEETCAAMAAAILQKAHAECFNPSKDSHRFRILQAIESSTNRSLIGTATRFLRVSRTSVKEDWELYRPSVEAKEEESAHA